MKNYSINFIKHYHESVIEDYSEKLLTDGYEISREFQIKNNIYCDLFARKGNKKIIYEFKILDSIKNIAPLEITKKFDVIEEYATQNNINFKVIYLNLPKKKKIEVEWLETKLLEYFMMNTINELDSLSTHTRINYIAIENIDNIILGNNIVLKNVNGTIDVSLQYGSDMETNEEDEHIISFPIDINVELNYDKEIENINYKINTDAFYL